MRYFPSAAAIGVAIICALTALPAVASQSLSLHTGTSTVLHFHDVTQVAVGDQAVLGALPLKGRNDVLLNGKAPGSTTLIVWTADGGRRSYTVEVTATSLDLLAMMLRSTIGRHDITVQTFGHALVLRGTVPDGSVLQAITDVITRFDPIAKQDGAIIVNAVMIAHPLNGLSLDAATDPALRMVRVDPDGQGNVIVSGRVLDETQRQDVLNDVRGLAGSYLSQNGKIIDRLAATLSTQIDVKVYILEVDDTGLSQLGSYLQTGTTTTGSNGNATTTYSGASAVTIPLVEQIANPAKPFVLGPFFRTTQLVPTIDLLINSGHARVLSEPDLTTVPGQEASFLVGGNIPVPQSSGLGSVSISYQPYGVQLKVTPTVLANGDIATKIAPEVSDLDFQDGVSLNGFVVPALKTSSISTNVITANGESIVMGGMLSQLEQRTIEKIPLLSQIPIIGRLFQDVRYQKQETNVVFVMTPTIINR